MTGRSRSRRQSCRVTAVALLLLVVPISVAKPQAGRSQIQFPPASGPWPRVAPDVAGWNDESLEKAIDFAFARKSSSVVILHQGRILAERHRKLPAASSRYAAMLRGATTDGHAIEDVASVQKSIVSVLIGIAQQKELLKLEDAVSMYLKSGWSQAPEEDEKQIHIRHLLTMTSGLTPALRGDSPAGKRWRYNTRAYAKLTDVLERATDRSIHELTQQWLTRPLGMRDSKWTPREWLKVDSSADANRLGFTTSARDLAKFGLMMQARGQWAEQRIIGAQEYLRSSWTASQKLNPLYGYLWWLNRAPRGSVNRRINRALIPAAPEDLASARGALGRRVSVARSLGLVVVRLGDTPDIAGRARFDTKFWELLMAAAPQRD